MEFVKMIRLPLGFAYVIYDRNSSTWGYMIHDFTKPEGAEDEVVTDFGFGTERDAIRAMIQEHGLGKEQAAQT